MFMKNFSKINQKTPGRISLRWIFVACLAICCQFAYSQNIQISGHVVDDKREDVIGASIVEKGTTNGTITDANGHFDLTVAKNAVLQVSYIGYKTQEITVGDKIALSIVLKEASKELGEVVVVGYGAQKKESVVGAISQITTKDLLNSPAANISQAIAGRIPGVITTQISGAPGADDALIYIRGRASFAGDNQPLILVDGVERQFSQIAPDDIETISVLKDASATAVYGVRGANGVILITTKRGKEQKPTVSLTANWQTQSPTRGNNYLDSYNSVLLLEEALANDGLPSQFSAADLDMYRKSVAGQLSGIDAMLYPNVDWYKTVLLNSTPAQRYNANIQGGTKRMKYFVSAEYYNQDGLFRNFSLDKYGNTSNISYQRYAFRANLDFLMTTDLTLSVNFGTRFENRKGPITPETFNADQNASYVYYSVNHVPGWIFPVAYTLGEGTDRQTLYGGSAQYQDNIVGRLARGGFGRTSNTINETNFIGDYKMDWLTKGLSAKVMVSFDYNAYYLRAFTAGFATYELNDRDNYQSIDAYNKFNTNTELTYAGDNQTTTYKLYMEAQLNYKRDFGINAVTGMLLYNQNDYQFQADLPARYQGLVGRATYGYDNRYLGEVNFGYNGSENFMRGHRFGFFPSFSLGWRISNEEFMKAYENWLNNLKIRVSYGEVGNDVYMLNGAKQRFLYQAVWTQLSNDYYFGTTGNTGIFESQYPNYAVTWERAHKYNAGIDFDLLKGMLGGSFDLFTEKRNNILTPYLTRPEWVGVNMAAGNLGETKNSGFEIELKHEKKIGKDFRYNVGLSFSHAANEILNMDEPALKTEYRKQTGHPIGQYFGLISDGFVTSADLANPDFPVSTFGDLKVGDLKYRDMNHDGFIDDRDVTFIGLSNVPENTYSLNLGANYKGFGLTLMFQGVDHVSRFYDADAMFAFVNGGKVKQLHLKRWNPNLSESENLANAQYPLLHYDSYGNHNQRLNSFFLKNGSFIRLKNIELGYNLPEKLIEKASMSDCRLYVNALNLVTWDHLDGLCDPESQGSSRYPIMKSVNFGVNIKF